MKCGLRRLYIYKCQGPRMPPLSFSKHIMLRNETMNQPVLHITCAHHNTIWAITRRREYPNEKLGYNKKKRVPKRTAILSHIFCVIRCPCSISPDCLAAHWQHSDSGTPSSEQCSPSFCRNHLLPQKRTHEPHVCRVPCLSCMEANNKWGSVNLRPQYTKSHSLLSSHLIVSWNQGVAARIWVS